MAISARACTSILKNDNQIKQDIAWSWPNTQDQFNGLNGSPTDHLEIKYRIKNIIVENEKNKNKIWGFMRNWSAGKNLTCPGMLHLSPT